MATSAAAAAPPPTERKPLYKLLYVQVLVAIMLGVIVGTLLGVLVSQLFIPYLQVGNTPADLVPPFLVEIAWPAIFRIYALFGALFAVALTALAFLLLRMKIFQAIKLGETV